jgi:hypothetical protein
MVRKNMLQRKLSKLRGDRKGTAEIVGSVMFLVILLFVFTNVYLWHDSATREMNGVLAQKMNTPVSIRVNDVGTGLVVTNNGGFEVGLERLWFVTDSFHVPVELRSLDLRVAAGSEVQLLFGTQTSNSNGDVEVWCPVTDEAMVCKILTQLGNMAACTYTSTTP